MDKNASCITINCGCCGNGTGDGAAEQSWENYSLDEIAIGTWIDGKTIYRKVIVGKLAAASGNEIVFADVSELAIHRVVNLYGNFIDTADTGIVFPISFNRTQSLGAAINMYFNGQRKELQYHFVNGSGHYLGCTAYVVLEYTKQDNDPATE